MKPEEELQALKVRAQTLAARLSWLESRIGQIEHRSRPSFLKARVDPDQCVGCGLCQASCPAGAIRVGNTASIDANRCLGCGRCAQACPQGAVSLRPQRLNLGRQPGRSF